MNGVQRIARCSTWLNRAPLTAADLAADLFADDFNQLEEQPELIHGWLEAAEGDRWFLEDTSRTAIFDAGFQQGVVQART